MQRKVVQGLPIWVDAQQRAFSYEPSDATVKSVWLGSYNPTTDLLELRPNWQTAYEARLVEYRASQAPRLRTEVPPATATTGKKKKSTKKAATS